MASRAANILQGAREALSIAKGETEAPKVYVAAEIDVRAIRAGLKMTQAEFAAAFGFPAGTLRDWEQGRTRPDQAARSYLMVIQHRPDAVRESLAMLQEREHHSREAAALLRKCRAAPGTSLQPDRLADHHECNADEAAENIRRLKGTVA